MSLNWQWSDKMGSIEYASEKFPNGNTNNQCKYNLYRGNAFCICVAETGEQYSLSWFMADKAHAMNLFGLNKKDGYTENAFADFRIKTIRLNTAYKETEILCQLLAKSHTNITIELYHE